MIVVLDHNLGFDPEFDTVLFSKLHVGVSSWKQLRTLYMEQEKSKHMVCALRKIDTIINELPDDWFELGISRDQFVKDVKLVLSKYKEKCFWEAIK